MPVCLPDAPMQKNTWDCGVFVCHYIFSMMSLRDLSFSANKRMFSNKRRAASLTKQWITEQDPFKFNMGDIVKLREQLASLVFELSLDVSQSEQPEQQQEIETTPKQEDQLETVELSRLTVKELKQKCKENGLKPGNHRKEALIEMLKELV